MTNSKQKLVLASGSPRRLELLHQIGIEPARLMPMDIDETPAKLEHPRALCRRLSLQKAEAAQAEAAKLEAQKAAAVQAGAAKAAAEAAPKKIPTQHKVAEGETLYRIAKMYGTTVPKIMEVNNMVNETIRVGQVLKLPKPEPRCTKGRSAVASTGTAAMESCPL